MTIAMNVFGHLPFEGLARQSGSDGQRTTSIVRLIDRRTGRALREGGREVGVATREPEETSAELLRGRDSDIWAVLVEPLPQTAASR